MQNIQLLRKDKSLKSVHMRKDHSTDMRAHMHSGDISYRQDDFLGFFRALTQVKHLTWLG